MFLLSKLFLLIRKIMCKFNIHYHPEDDGFYIEGLSYGKCYCCGKFIKKTSNGWVEAKD